VGGLVGIRGRIFMRVARDMPHLDIEVWVSGIVHVLYM